MHKSISYVKKNASRIPDLSIGISFYDLVAALRKLSTSEREDYIENLLAATAPEYINSIKEARADYKQGRIQTHNQVFGAKKKK